MGRSSHEAALHGRCTKMGRVPDDLAVAFGDDRSVADEDRADDVTELIEAGRDREAAQRGASASAGPVGPHQRHGGPMDPLTQFDQLGPPLGGVVAGITPDQLDRPTPCAEFTVRGRARAHGRRGDDVRRRLPRRSAGRARPHRRARRLRPDARGPRRRHQRSRRARPDDRRPLRRGPRRDVRPLRRPRRPGPRLGPGHRHRPALRPARRARGRGRGVRPQASSTPLRDGETFADAVEPPAGASPIERLAAYTGRRPSRRTP